MKARQQPPDQETGNDRKATGRSRFSAITVAAITRARPSRPRPMVTAVAVCKRDCLAR
jgi:hypothetical protein